MALTFNKAKGAAQKSSINTFVPQDGDNNVRLVGDVLARYVYWIEGENGKNIPLECLSFDRDEERFNNQEKDSLRLILCEIVTAFSINSLDGNFVLKIYDIFLDFTIDLIYLLSKYYNNVYITKPHTSRPANSEKYVVCKGFKGIDDYNLNKLYNIVDSWSDTNIYSRLFKESIPDNLIYGIYSINKIVLKTQIENILRTILLLLNKLNNYDIKNIKNIPLIYALEWCKKYNIDIDNYSKYIKKKSPYYKKIH